MADASDDQDYFGGLAQDLLGQYRALTAQNTGLASGLGQGAQPGSIPQAPSPPLSTVAANPSSGDYATVYYYKGMFPNLFGHIGLSLDGGRAYGLEPIPGKDMESVIGTVPGIVAPVDPERVPVDQERIPVTAAQVAQLQQYLLKNAGHTPYSASGPNCATFVSDALQSAGLKSPASHFAERPTSLMSGLHQIYDDSSVTPYVPNVRFSLPKY